MKVSVLVPTFKRAAYLEKCLISLFNQKRLPDEIISITVRGDTDTHNLIERFRQEGIKGEIIKEVLIDKANIVYAENQGLASAVGDIICFIDDDATAFDDWIERILKHYEADSSIGGVGGPVIPFVSGAPVIEYTKIFGQINWWGRRITNTRKVPVSLQEVDMLRGCNMSFRRALLKKFDENLLPYWRRFEDDACLSVKAQGYKIISDPQVLVLHFEFPVLNNQRIDNTKETIIGLNHNSIYVKLKHFKSLRKICAVIYEFILGDETTPGLLALIIYAVLRLDLHKLYIFYFAFLGKIMGIWTYFKIFGLRGRQCFS